MLKRKEKKKEKLMIAMPSIFNPPPIIICVQQKGLIIVFELDNINIVFSNSHNCSAMAIHV